MKQLAIILLVFSTFCSAQNFTLPESGKKKALSKAKAESVMYTKKGFATKDGSDMKQNILDFYNEVYLVDEKKVPKYVWGMGTAKKATEKEAYDKAYQDAIDNMPGLMITYFQMWTMASKASDDDRNKVQMAIGDASKAITQACNAVDYTVMTYLVNEAKGKFQVHVRTLTNQSALKELARKEIMKELKKATDWNEEKMIELLTFEK